MDRDKVIEVLENEITCVKLADTCNRDCGECPIVREDTEIISALQYAIDTVKRGKNKSLCPFRRSIKRLRINGTAYKPMEFRYIELFEKCCKESCMAYVDGRCVRLVNLK